MAKGTYRREGHPAHRYELTTRNKKVIQLCEKLRAERKLSKTIEELLLMERGNGEKVREEIIEKFLGKFVKLERRSIDLGRPWRIFGTIEDITEDGVLISTKDGFNTIKVEDILSIKVWDD